MRRRQFIKRGISGGLAFSCMSLSLPNVLFSNDSFPDAVWIENGEPDELLRNALKMLGGMERFIQKGDTVVVKPNIGWDRAPELAATTNPDLVGGIVKAALEAGAKKVKVLDRTCNNPRRCYRNTRIEEKASEAGADVLQVRDSRYKKVAVNGRLISDWPIYKDYLEADKIINVPVAKHHSLSRVTLGLKNLMGVMGGERGDIHNNFAIKLAEINKKILPTLTIIDAYRILKDNGPSGGNPGDVQQTRTLIASPCTVSADYLALELFGLKLHQVDHVKHADASGLSKFDLKKLNVKRLKLA